MAVESRTPQYGNDNRQQFTATMTTFAAHQSTESHIMITVCYDISAHQNVLTTSWSSVTVAW